MNLETICRLSLGDGNILNQGDKIQVEFVTEEILQGIYTISDEDTLTIQRNGKDIFIEFEEIKDIKVLIRS